MVFVCNYVTSRNRDATFFRTLLSLALYSSVKKPACLYLILGWLGWLGGCPGFVLNDRVGLGLGVKIEAISQKKDALSAKSQQHQLFKLLNSYKSRRSRSTRNLVDKVTVLEKIGSEINPIWHGV